MQSLTLISPAKVNFFFQVLKKRSDGYHDIASLYQTISLSDILKVSIGSEDSFTCTEKNLETPCNLVVQALNLFRKEFKIKQSVKVHLEKKIPIQAGLGGGSSNAATVLWALRQIFLPNLPLEILVSMAAKLGADIPFFFSKGSAVCKGIGTIVEEIQIPPYSFWVLQPNFGLSTPEVFRKVEVKKPDKSYKELVESYQKKSPLFYNDLQIAAKSTEKKIDIIQKTYPQSAMTGSGSCFFSFVEPKRSLLVNTIYPVRSIYRDTHSWYSFI